VVPATHAVWQFATASSWRCRTRSPPAPVSPRPRWRRSGYSGGRSRAGHPDLGQSLNNLATFYEKQDRYPDSEPLFKRALAAIYQKAAGPEHPAVSTLLNNIGQVDRCRAVLLKASR